MKSVVRQKKLLSLLIASASFSAPVLANDTTTYPDESPTLLNQVTVSATRTERQLDDVSSSVSVISAEQMEQQMARNIRDLVKYNPGVTVGSDDRFGLAGFNIRGMEENRVKITVDGVNQAKSFGYDRSLQSQRNMFDIETMKQLEILKGPASSIYGSDAIGGVAAFVTKDPADFLNATGDDSYLSLKAGYASADSSHSETATIANRTGDFESLLVYTHRGGHETESFGGVGGLGETRERANPQDNKSDSVLGKLQYQINDDNRIGLTAEWRKAKSDTDLLAEDGEVIEQCVANGAVCHQRIYSEQRAEDTATRQRLSFFHEWNANLMAFDEMKWSLDWQESESEQITHDRFVGRVPMGQTGIITNDDQREKNYRYTEEGIHVDAIFNKSLFAFGLDHYLTYGVNVDEVTYSNKNQTFIVDNQGRDPDEFETEDWMPEVERRQYGLFVQNEITLLDDRLTVTPALRYDRFDEKIKSLNNYKGDASQLNDDTMESLTGRFGAVYTLNDVWSVYGQFSQGFSAPDVFAKYFNYQMGSTVNVLANPDLKPEESNSFEIGLRANTGIASMELTAFYNKYKNFIEEGCVGTTGCSASGGTFQYQNLSTATIEGIEFKGSLLLDEWLGAPAGTRFNTAIAYAKGRGDKPGENNTTHKDEPLNSVAPLTAVLGIGYDAPAGNWGGEAVWTLVAAKDKDDISNVNDISMGGDQGADKFAPSGYGIVDLTAYYKPTDSITVNAGVFNVTDKKYFLWNDVRNITVENAGINRYTQPGRNYGVSLKWEF